MVALRTPVTGTPWPVPAHPDSHTLGESGYPARLARQKLAGQIRAGAYLGRVD
jgi:hypothetical protein